MERGKLEELKQKLYSKTPLIGGWQRRKAATELAQASQAQDAAATSLLAQALVENTDPQVKTIALDALKQVKDQKCVDAVCADWASSRHSELTKLLVDTRWVASAPARLRTLTALKVGQLDLLSKGGAETFEAIFEMTRDKDGDVVSQAKESLNKLQNSEAIDALCIKWIKERDSYLGQIIVQKNYVARQPIEAQIFSALKCGKLDVVTKASPDVLDSLLRACLDSDEELVKNAKAALRQLKNADTQEALCNLVLEKENKIAREAAIDAGYLPKTEEQKILFYFFSEQWDKYEALDPKQRTLRAIHQKSDPILQDRIAIKVKQKEYSLAEPVKLERKRQKLANMTSKEWEMLLDQVENSQQRADILRLAQEAPPRWSKQVLFRMKKSGWKPRGDEKASYEELLNLAEKCDSIDPNSTSTFVLKGHTDVINTLAMSSDGSIVASGSLDNSVRIWNLALGKEIKVLSGQDGHSGAINCLAISPDSKTLISGSADGTLKLWDLPNGTLRKTLTGHTDEVNCLVISPNGKMLASGSLDNGIKLWSLPNGDEIKEIKEHSGSIWSLSFSPDGNVLASGGGLSDHSIKLWTVPECAAIQTLEGHKGLVRCLSFSNNGKFLASSSGDNTIKLWQLSDGRELKTLKGHQGLIHSLILSPNGKHLFSGSVDKTIRLWNLSDGKVIKKLDKHKDRITSLISDSDLRSLISSSWDGTIRLWSTVNQLEIKVLEGHTNWVTCLSLSPNGETLVSGSRDNTLRVWPLKSILLSHLPARQTTVADLAWAEKAIKSNEVPNSNRKELEFISALMRWRNKLENSKDTLHQIEVGEFEIELAG
jgi:WD40 repeat protein